MRLDRVLDGVEVLELVGDPATEVESITHRADAALPGSLFCCIPGSAADGHDFAGAAVERGAVALLCERVLPLEVAQARVASARPAMAQAAAALNGHPSRDLRVVGVTGTNGKTTTTYLISAILEAAGVHTGVIGTMSGSRTTPEAPLLQQALAAFREGGAGAVAMEVSSVGLVQHRVDAVQFAVGVFTNLSHDHLEHHHTMEAYFEAKARLFEPERCAQGVVNGDDPYGRRLLECARVPLRAFSMTEARDLELGQGWSSFRFEGASVRLQLDGDFNVANALAAAVTARALDVPSAAIAEGLSAVSHVPGHVEPVDAGQPFRVVVDYAHTPAALASVLSATRRTLDPGGRLIVVFGCGGDRDPTKRAPMGSAASRLADLVVVTSDNPRSEDPEAIIRAVVAGATGPGSVETEPDRRAAIALALSAARPGDAVVIAGKGHETGQEIGGRVLPFDDRAVSLELLAELVS